MTITEEGIDNMSDKKRKLKQQQKRKGLMEHWPILAGLGIAAVVSIWWYQSDAMLRDFILTPDMWMSKGRGVIQAFAMICLLVFPVAGWFLGRKLYKRGLLD